MFYGLSFWWNFCFINCTTLITNDDNTILGNENMIKYPKKAHTMLLVAFDSMLMKFYVMLDLEESYKSNLIPRDKQWFISSL